MLYHVRCRAVVEPVTRTSSFSLVNVRQTSSVRASRGRGHSPRVEFVYNAFEPYDGEQTSGKPGHPCQQKDGERDEAFPSGRVGQQRLHTDIRVRGVEIKLTWIVIYTDELRCVHQYYR